MLLAFFAMLSKRNPAEGFSCIAEIQRRYVAVSVYFYTKVLRSYVKGNTLLRRTSWPKCVCLIYLYGIAAAERPYQNNAWT